MDPKTFNPDKLGVRSLAAFHAILEAPVWNDDWHRWRDVVDLMLEHSDILPRSCSNILAGMVATGRAEARGEWSRRRDTREIRFIDLDAAGLDEA